MSLGLAIAAIFGGALLIAALLTLAVEMLWPSRTPLLTNEGGSPALRVITTTYALLLAFVMASSLQSFQSARQETAAEADSVVAVGNLANELPGAAGAPLRRNLACYAYTVTYRDYPAVSAGRSLPDDNRPLRRLYEVLPDQAHASQAELSTDHEILAQLSTLTAARDTRIRAARDTLPALLWWVVISGGVIMLLALAAVTVPDRRWSQLWIIAGAAAIIIGGILLISELDKPFSGQVSISAGPMKSALAAVAIDVPRPYC